MRFVPVPGEPVNRSTASPPEDDAMMCPDIGKNKENIFIYHCECNSFISIIQ